MIAKELEGENYEITITSGNDGKHSKHSLHYKNKAIDIRTRDMEQKEKVWRRIKYTLGRDYDVILEDDHIHIEYDPKIVQPKPKENVQKHQLGKSGYRLT